MHSPEYRTQTRRYPLPQTIVNLLQLPDELIVHIMHHLNVEEIGRLARVNRRFSKAATQDALWQAVFCKEFPAAKPSGPTWLSRIQAWTHACRQSALIERLSSGFSEHLTHLLTVKPFGLPDLDDKRLVWIVFKPKEPALVWPGRWYAWAKVALFAQEGFFSLSAMIDCFYVKRKYGPWILYTPKESSFVQEINAKIAETFARIAIEPS